MADRIWLAEPPRGGDAEGESARQLGEAAADHHRALMAFGAAANPPCRTHGKEENAERCTATERARMKKRRSVLRRP